MAAGLHGFPTQHARAFARDAQEVRLFVSYWLYLVQLRSQPAERLMRAALILLLGNLAQGHWVLTFLSMDPLLRPQPLLLPRLFGGERALRSA